MTAYEHRTVQIENVTLRTNDDGLFEAKIDDGTEIQRVHTPSTDH